MEFIIFVLVAAAIWHFSLKGRVNSRSLRHPAKTAMTRSQRAKDTIQSAVPTLYKSQRPSVPPLIGIEITPSQRRLLGHTDPSVIASPLPSKAMVSSALALAAAPALIDSVSDSKGNPAIFNSLFAEPSDNFFDDYGLNASYSDSFPSFSNSLSSFDNDVHTTINPATGLPMLGNSNLDVAGNPYGSDLSSLDNSWSDPFSSSSMNSFSEHDSFGSSSSNDW
ncbi:hypothetical protein [Acinetobacter sp. ASP199]|uniref:hypothetical protein n=1 Tax=unclassified Acinetobacter TaxID=196816 RepID=UPI001F607089|nr:hypothetical protein [Acinetobacter sp. ASP199]UNT59592.1 hypothetical protein IHE35_01815 [Acinetobacter sp. ASP199]